MSLIGSGVDLMAEEGIEVKAHCPSCNHEVDYVGHLYKHDSCAIYMGEACCAKCLDNLTVCRDTHKEGGATDGAKSSGGDEQHRD